MLEVVKLLERLPKNVRDAILYYRKNREEALSLCERASDKTHKQAFLSSYYFNKDKLSGYLWALEDVGLITNAEHQALCDFELKFAFVDTDAKAEGGTDDAED